MRFYVLMIFLLLTTGCAKVVDDFVAGGDPAMDPPAVIDLEDDRSLKLSPGIVRATSAGGVGMTARITTTRHVMTGTNMSAVVGLHKSR